jgi:mRNA-degrading endonuclease RelE of RelBE toxin-antitoxin system
LKRLIWAEQAIADVRAIDRTMAMRILIALHEFAKSGSGDVKNLRDQDGLRLRVGDYRLMFNVEEPNAIKVRRVLHRSEAYR